MTRLIRWVLLIMGTSAQGTGWPDELVEVLAKRGRQVIRFDHRDTGHRNHGYAQVSYQFGGRPIA